MAARAAALRLYADVTLRGQSLDARLDAPDSPLNELAPQDRSLARAIASTALRRRGQISAALRGLMQRKLPPRAGSLPAILEIAAAQILFLSVPDHAAVSTALELADGDGKARHFKPLANGVLRNLVRGRDEILAAQDAARLNTPDWLWDRWVAAYGECETQAIAAAHLVEAPLDLSVADRPAAWAERLGGWELPTGTVRLGGRGRIEGLAGFEDGAWWVQDAAAALPARLLGDVAGRRVLDLCAAPGGKTAQLAAAGARVTAVDISKPRLNRVRANLKRLGLEAECIAADATAFKPTEPFDAVLLDAPCSSTGTIRRHPDIPWLKQEADVEKLAALQRRLLAKAVAVTRPGGTIVFATCSLEPEEGTHQAAAALEARSIEPVPLVAGEIAGLQQDWIRGGHLRTLPCHQPQPGGSGGMDGFFAARFRKQ